MFGSSGKGQDGSGGKAEKTLGDFTAEYAKSNRSTCKGCMEKIEKVALESQCLHFWGSHLKSGALAISGEKSKQPLHCGSTMVGNTVESLVEGGAAVLGRPSPCSCAAVSMGRGPGRKMLESTGIGPQSQAGVGEFLCSWFEVRRTVWAFSTPGLSE